MTNQGDCQVCDTIKSAQVSKDTDLLTNVIMQCTICTWVCDQALDLINSIKCLSFTDDSGMPLRCRPKAYIRLCSPQKWAINIKRKMPRVKVHQ
jgi:hypothetical protein